MDEQHINYALELTNDEGIINVNIFDDKLEFYFTPDAGEQRDPLCIPRAGFEWIMSQYSKLIPPINLVK